MTDLIERLRNVRGSFVIPIEAPDVFGWADEAADRIEELEAEKAESRRWKNLTKLKELEVQLRNAKEQLELSEAENRKLQAYLSQPYHSL